MSAHGAPNLLTERPVSVGGAAGFDRPGGWYDFGFDHAMPYTSDKAQHSTGFGFGRCADLPPSDRSTKASIFLWCMFPGPRHAKANYDHLLAPLVAEMRRLRHGIHLYDTYLEREDTHFPYLGLIYADTKAREPMLKTMAVGAYMCDYRSTYRCPTQVAYNYPKGYVTPHAQMFATAQGELVTEDMDAWDERLMLNHETATTLGNAVADGTVRCDVAGRHGVSPFERLEYFNAVWQVPLPWIHGTIWGITKDFWRMMIGKMDNNSLSNSFNRRGEKISLDNHILKTWQLRGKGLETPVDFNRSYKCIVECQGQWVMEDWLSWTLFFSEIVVGDTMKVHQPKMHEAWQHLREAIFYHLRPSSFMEKLCPMSDRKELSNKAHEHLKCFAQIMEQDGPANALTLNLRMTVVHSQRQEFWTGCMYHTTEFWVERAISWMKQRIGKSSRNPEVIMGNSYLWEQEMSFGTEIGDALHNMERSIMETDNDSSIGGSRGVYDMDQDGGIHGLGPAGNRQRIGRNRYLDNITVVPEDMREKVVRHLMTSPDVTIEDIHSVHMFRQASICGEVVHSKQSNRARTRVSHHVQVKVRNEVTYGDVLGFYVIRSRKMLDGVVQETVTRLATVELYEQAGGEEQRDNRGFVKLRRATNATSSKVVIPCKDILGKVIVHQLGEVFLAAHLYKRHELRF